MFSLFLLFKLLAFLAFYVAKSILTRIELTGVMFCFLLPAKLDESTFKNRNLAL